MPRYVEIGKGRYIDMSDVSAIVPLPSGGYQITTRSRGQIVLTRADEIADIKRFVASLPSWEESRAAET